MKRSENPKAIEAHDRSPIFLSIGDNVTALTNTSITIRCPTSGVPAPTVMWTKNGQQILIGDRYQVQDDGSLLIVKAHEADSALYTCRADSVAGKDSASTVVQVVGKYVRDENLQQLFSFKIFMHNVIKELSSVFLKRLIRLSHGKK